jgi:flagellin-like protein
MELIFNMDKKAQSQIVTAVLLILIVIALAVIILNFSTNFVKDKLSSTGCFEAVGQVTFTNSNKYTCFNPKTPSHDHNDDHDHNDYNELNLQVHIGDINESLAGFLLETGGATTRSIEIRAGNKDVDKIYMYKKLDADPLEIPGKNEERTYVINLGDDKAPETVKIYPILTDGQVCEASDVLESIGLCRG